MGAALALQAGAAGGELRRRWRHRRGGARQGLPARTLAEFIAHAKANPGKQDYGSAGNGTLQHIAAEALMRATSIEVTHVPYKGSQQVLVGQTNRADESGRRIGRVN
jgi:hypothetical protein